MVQRKGISPLERNPSTGKESVRRKGIRPAERNQFGGKESVQRKGISPAERTQLSKRLGSLHHLTTANQSSGKE